MKRGTKSLLFGCHQFLLHPIFVLIAWKKLYGWPNWKELVCILIHDWGYWDSPNMDGPEGEDHPWRAALFVAEHIDKLSISRVCEKIKLRLFDDTQYFQLCLYHSRFMVKRHSKLGVWETIKPSKLCYADKLGTALMPAWLWVSLSWLSGEQQEYMDNQRYELYGFTCPWEFFRAYRVLVDSLLESVEKEQTP